MIFLNAIDYYFPKKEVNNKKIIEDFHRFVNSNDESLSEEGIFEKTGVRRRFESELSSTAKDLGISAAQELFQSYNINKSSIQAVIFVSDALDYKGPATACVIQAELELPKSVLAFDVLQGCTGWIYGLSLAKGLIASDQVDNVLLITADIPRRVIHPEDIELSALFSDASAATIISKSHDSENINGKINNFDFGTDGKGRPHLFMERSASKMPADIEWLDQYKHLPSGLQGGRLRMNSDKVFLFALRTVPMLTKNILKKNGLTKSDIDYFVFHQANGIMLEFLRKRMKIPKEKFIINIEQIGNTVSSSIPIALSQLFKKTQLRKGMKLLVAGFGIGFSWGGTILIIE